MYVCLFATDHVLTHTHTHTHTYIHTYIHTSDSGPKRCVFAHIVTQAYIHTYIYTYIHQIRDDFLARKMPLRVAADQVLNIFQTEDYTRYKTLLR
jgi:hypothetical protein